MPIRTTASSTMARTAALSPKNNAAIDRHIAVAGIDVAERHDGDDAGHHEQAAGHDAAERAMHQPADIGRKLLRLGAGQQHAIVERVQETALRNPALLLDQDAVHHRDLAGGTAEAQHRDAKPDPERLAQRHAVLKRRIDRLSAIASSATPGLLHCRGRPVVRFRLEIATPGIERVVHHHAVPEHFVIVRKVRGQAERDGEQAAALRGQIVAGRVGSSDDLGEMVESRDP